ncbi:A24 family peptidase [Massilia sp. SYSU DXS3249]
MQITEGQLSLFGIYTLPLQLLVLCALLLLATAIDVRERRIPNWLVASGTLGAIAFHSMWPQGEGLSFTLSGLVVGMASLIPLYVLRLMGAGDVKLMGMIGAFLGMSGVLGAVLASMAAGGILALAMATGKRMLPQLLANLRGMLVQYHFRHVTRGPTGPASPASSVGSMPYAVAITAGTLAQLTFLRY